MLALTAYLWQSTKRLLRPLVRRCWTCPICGYYGPFYGINASYSIREHAGCPSCNHLERHRLQWLVLGRITPNLPLDQMSVLHFAPERFFSDYLRPRVVRYETADLERVGVDHRVDLRSLPFADSSYDFV